MARILLSLDAHDMLALRQGRYQNQSDISTKFLLETVEFILADVKQTYGGEPISSVSSSSMMARLSDFIKK
jgi:hypothetical protein